MTKRRRLAPPARINVSADGYSFQLVGLPGELPDDAQIEPRAEVAHPIAGAPSRGKRHRGDQRRRREERASIMRLIEMHADAPIGLFTGELRTGTKASDAGAPMDAPARAMEVVNATRLRRPWLAAALYAHLPEVVKAIELHAVSAGSGRRKGTRPARGRMAPTAYEEHLEELFLLVHGESPGAERLHYERRVALRRRPAN